MTLTTYYTATTLDGFIADEHDSLDWLFSQDQDPDGPMAYGAFITGVGALVMGATTYRWIRDRMAETGEAWAYTQPCWVFTHQDVPIVEDADVRIVSGEVAAHWDAIAASAGDLGVWVVGGGDLAGQFAQAGHLDEVILYVAPVTLGAGRPLLPRRLDLRLLEVDRNRDFVCVRYAVELGLPNS